MSKSFVAAAAARAAAARLTETLTVLVGPESEHVRVRIDCIPPNTFLGALLRQQRNFDGTTSLAENSAEFLRLLARFWDGATLPSTPKAFDEFEIFFGGFCDVYSPVASGDWDDALARWDDAALAMAMAFAPTSRSCCEEIDRLDLIQSSRVTLVLRGSYLDIPARPRETATVQRWSTRAATPGVVNELRVRCVAVSSRPNSSVPCIWRAEWGEPSFTELRVLPAYTLYGRLSSDGPDAEWQPICAGRPYTGDKMEVRTFVSANVPLRRRCPDALAESFLALDDAMLWAELDFHGDDDLTLDLARRVVARKSKLKNFLKPSETPGADPLLKTWPGKDAMQAMAVWYMAATLIEGHEYTEPELSCVMSSLCAFPPDHGVLRKEMVRRGFLGQPNIVTNADKTTATYFSVSGEGLRAVLRGEWRQKGVF